MPGTLGLTLMAEDYGGANGSHATLKSADNHRVLERGAENKSGTFYPFYRPLLPAPFYHLRKNLVEIAHETIELIVMQPMPGICIGDNFSITKIRQAPIGFRVGGPTVFAPH